MSLQIQPSCRLLCSHIAARTNPTGAQAGVLQLLDAIGVDLSDVISTWVSHDERGVVIDFSLQDKRDAALIGLQQFFDETGDTQSVAEAVEAPRQWDWLGTFTPELQKQLEYAQSGLHAQLRAIGADLLEIGSGELETLYREKAQQRLRQLMDRAYIAGPPGARPDTVVLRRIPLEALGWKQPGGSSSRALDDAEPDVLSDEAVESCIGVVRRFFHRFGRISNANVVPYRAHRAVGGRGPGRPRAGRRGSVEIADAAGASSGAGRALRERRARKEDDPPLGELSSSILASQASVVTGTGGHVIGMAGPADGEDSESSFDSVASEEVPRMEAGQVWLADAYVQFSYYAGFARAMAALSGRGAAAGSRVGREHSAASELATESSVGNGGSRNPKTRSLVAERQAQKARDKQYPIEFRPEFWEQEGLGGAPRCGTAQALGGDAPGAASSGASLFRFTPLTAKRAREVRRRRTLALEAIHRSDRQAEALATGELAPADFQEEVAAYGREARKELQRLEEEFVREVVGTIVFPAQVEYDTSGHFYSEASRGRRKERIQARAQARLAKYASSHETWMNATKLKASRKKTLEFLSAAHAAFDSLLSLGLPAGDAALREIVKQGIVRGLGEQSPTGGPKSSRAPGSKVRGSSSPGLGDATSSSIATSAFKDMLAFGGPSARRLISFVLSKPQAIALLRAELACLEAWSRSGRQELVSSSFRTRVQGAVRGAQRFDGSSSIPSLQRILAGVDPIPANALDVDDALQPRPSEKEDDGSSSDESNVGEPEDDDAAVAAIFDPEVLAELYDQFATIVEEASNLVPYDILDALQNARLAVEAATVAAARIGMKAPEQLVSGNSDEYGTVVELLATSDSKSERVHIVASMCKRALQLCATATRRVKKCESATMLQRSLCSGVLSAQEKAETRRQLRRLGPIKLPPRLPQSSGSVGLPDALWAIEHMLGATRFSAVLRESGGKLSNCTIFVVSDALFQDELFWRTTTILCGDDSEQRAGKLLGTAMLRSIVSQSSEQAEILDSTESTASNDPPTAYSSQLPDRKSKEEHVAVQRRDQGAPDASHLALKASTPETTSEKPPLSGRRSRLSESKSVDFHPDLPPRSPYLQPPTQFGRIQPMETASTDKDQSNARRPNSVNPRADDEGAARRVSRSEDMPQNVPPSPISSTGGNSDEGSESHELSSTPSRVSRGAAVPHQVVEAELQKGCRLHEGLPSGSRIEEKVDRRRPRADQGGTAEQEWLRDDTIQFQGFLLEPEKPIVLSSDAASKDTKAEPEHGKQPCSCLQTSSGNTQPLESPIRGAATSAGKSSRSADLPADSDQRIVEQTGAPALESGAQSHDASVSQEKCIAARQQQLSRTSEVIATRLALAAASAPAVASPVPAAALRRAGTLQKLVFSLDLAIPPLFIAGALAPMQLAFGMLLRQGRAVRALGTMAEESGTSPRGITGMGWGSALRVWVDAHVGQVRVRSRPIVNALVLHPAFDPVFPGVRFGISIVDPIVVPQRGETLGPPPPARLDPDILPEEYSPGSQHHHLARSSGGVSQSEHPIASSMRQRDFDRSAHEADKRSSQVHFTDTREESARIELDQDYMKAEGRQEAVVIETGPSRASTIIARARAAAEQASARMQAIEVQLKTWSGREELTPSKSSVARRRFASSPTEIDSVDEHVMLQVAAEEMEDDGMDEYEQAQELERTRQAHRRAKAVALLAHGSQHDDDGGDVPSSPARPAPLEDGPGAMSDGMEDRRLLVAPQGDMFADATEWTMQDALAVPYSPRDEPQSHHGVLTWVVEGAAGLSVAKANGRKQSVSSDTQQLEAAISSREQASKPPEIPVPERSGFISTSRPQIVPALDLSILAGKDDTPRQPQTADGSPASEQIHRSMAPQSMSVVAATGGGATESTSQRFEDRSEIVSVLRPARDSEFRSELESSPPAPRSIDASSPKGRNVRDSMQDRPIRAEPEPFAGSIQRVSRSQRFEATTFGVADRAQGSSRTEAAVRSGGAGLAGGTRGVRGVGGGSVQGEPRAQGAVVSIGGLRRSRIEPFSPSQHSVGSRRFDTFAEEDEEDAASVASGSQAPSFLPEQVGGRDSRLGMQVGAESGSERSSAAGRRPQVPALSVVAYSQYGGASSVGAGPLTRRRRSVQGSIGADSNSGERTPDSKDHGAAGKGSAAGWHTSYNSYGASLPRGSTGAESPDDFVGMHSDRPDAAPGEVLMQAPAWKRRLSPIDTGDSTAPVAISASSANSSIPQHGERSPADVSSAVKIEPNAAETARDQIQPNLEHGASSRAQQVAELPGTSSSRVFVVQSTGSHRGDAAPRRRTADPRVLMQHIVPGCYTVEDLLVWRGGGGVPAAAPGVSLQVSAGSSGGGRMEVRAVLQQGGSFFGGSYLDPRAVEDPDESSLAGQRKSIAIGSMRRSLAEGRRAQATRANPLARGARQIRQLDFFATTNGYPSVAADARPQSTAASAREEARRMVQSSLVGSPARGSGTRRRGPARVIGGSLPAVVLQRNIKCAGGVMLHLLDRSFALDPISR